MVQHNINYLLHNNNAMFSMVNTKHHLFNVTRILSADCQKQTGCQSCCLSPQAHSLDTGTFSTRSGPVGPCLQLIPAKKCKMTLTKAQKLCEILFNDLGNFIIWKTFLQATRHAGDLSSSNSQHFLQQHGGKRIGLTAGSPETEQIWIKLDKKYSIYLID